MPLGRISGAEKENERSQRIREGEVDRDGNNGLESLSRLIHENYWKSGPPADDGELGKEQNGPAGWRAKMRSQLHSLR
jgi:hypothetical protein